MPPTRSMPLWNIELIQAIPSLLNDHMPVSSTVWGKCTLYVWRHQDVKTICCSGYDHSRNLSVPMNFFQVLLTLYKDKEPLPLKWWNYRRNYSSSDIANSLEEKKKGIRRGGFAWWTNRSCGGRSSGAFTCSFVLALNSASSSSSFSNERSHILVQEAKWEQKIIAFDLKTRNQRKALPQKCICMTNFNQFLLPILALSSVLLTWADCRMMKQPK